LSHKIDHTSSTARSSPCGRSRITGTALNVGRQVGSGAEAAEDDETGSTLASVRRHVDGKCIGSAALEGLKRYRWPGNVRELEDLVRRLAALYPQETITENIVEAELDQPAIAVANGEAEHAETLSGSVERHLATYFGGFGENLPPPGLYHRILREVESPLISGALASTRGNQIKAAELLGVNRNTLRKKIRDLDISDHPQRAMR
jgi:DNA-binding NtrC family response regulator